MKRFSTFFIILAASLALAQAASSTAPPAPMLEAQNRAIGVVASSDSGEGIAPDAPAEVRLQIERVMRGTASLASGSKTVWARRNYDSVAGFNLWRYYEQIAFGYNGSVVTGFYRYRWATLNGPFWDFKGHIGSNCSTEHCSPGRTGAYREAAYTQGKFAVCAAWCTNTRLPIVYIAVFGNGSWGSTTSG